MRTSILAVSAAVVLLCTQASAVPFPNPPLYPSIASPPGPTFQTLYTFRGAPDGALPFGVVFDSHGNLYGAARDGGKTASCPTDSVANISDGTYVAGCGVVFKLAPGKTWAESVLYSFADASDGAYPAVGLVWRDSSLYGTNQYGGYANKTTCVGGCGTVFAYDTATAKLDTLHTFTGGSDSGGPYSGVVFDAAGNIYGSVEGGDGATPIDDLAFKLVPPATGKTAWTFDALHSFGDNSATSQLVINKTGMLYGTTKYGGTFTACSSGCGTIFQLDPTTRAATVLHNFTGTDGEMPPDGGLTIDYLADGSFVLYGVTTEGGGTKNAGTVFMFDPATRVLTTLHTFTGSDDGGRPYSALRFRDGALYGSTLSGGAHGAGVVFKLAPGNPGWTETVLHTFTGGADGGNPIGPMAFDSIGALYGSTGFGGDVKACPNKKNPSGCGTIFKITP